MASKITSYLSNQRLFLPVISGTSHRTRSRQVIASISIISSLHGTAPLPKSCHNSCSHQPQRLYGTRTKVELDPPGTPPHPQIAPYVRHCLSGIGNPNTHPQSNEFCITFLGTSSGSATMHRSGSSTALRLGGMTYLFDCAEGTCRQILFSRIGIFSITKIFISHLHGDHLYGIVPIVLEIQVAAKLAKQAAENNPTKQNTRKRRDRTTIDDKPTLEIFGPPGLYNYIAMTLALSCAKVNYLNVVVTELVGGREERGPVEKSSAAMGNGRRGRRNAFLSHYPELETGLLKRRYLEMNKEDRTWTISSPPTIEKEVLESGMLIRQNGFRELPNDTNTGFDRQLFVKAAELDHLKGVQTFGYTVEEQTPPGIIDAEKAKALGLQPSKKYSLLKCGIPVTSDDGSVLIEPHQVLAQTFRARKLAFLADHRRVPESMAKLCTNSDVLIQEATLSIKDGIDKVKIRGHNNAYNAGVNGNQFGCQVVALNHFASINAYEGNVDEMVREAQTGNDGASRIVASYDFMELWVPRGGFEFDGRIGAEGGHAEVEEDGEETVLNAAGA